MRELWRHLKDVARGWATRSSPGTSSVPIASVKRYELCLADLSPEDIRNLIIDLNSVSETVGCAIFRPPGEHGCVVTIFAGNLERFFMLAVARNLRCPVIYVQDTVSWWYQGSPLLPDLDALCHSIIVPEIGSARALFFGQSSGAYAALAASVWSPGATTLACAPQTFSDVELKNRIRFVGVRALQTPLGLLDLRARLLSKPDPVAVRAAVIAAGELDNPAHAHWWGDFLHALRLTDVPDIDLFVVNANTHVLAHGRANQFASLLDQLSSSISKSKFERLRIVEAFLHENYHRSL